MHIGLLILDGRGRIALLNAAAEEMLGYRAPEARGKPGEEILDGLTDLLAGLDSKRPERQLKRNARHKDGRIIPLLVTPYAVPNDGGGLIFVFQDERQLQKMENQLQHLDRLYSLDQFAAGIVHEIRNPLAGISLNAQLIVEEINRHCRKSCRKMGWLDRFQEEMQDILADVESIESIVKRVLDFAHPNKSQVREEPIEDIVKEVLRFSKMPLRRQGIRLLTSLNAPAKVKVDVSQMKQVLFNIVRNACDAMPKGGELRVSTGRASPPSTPRSGDPRGPASDGSAGPSSRSPVPRPSTCSGRSEPAEGRGLRKASPSPPAEGVRVEVEDTGRGIPEKYLERIFDPFFSMNREGTGLGLAISRKIVENHGGRIEVESEPGKGTKFGIVLPAVCPSARSGHLERKIEG